ncbi:MAG TPA: PDZ domain-containing protein, partial [Bacteroidetes bacterium]|nr:PDZ domain-containing protein [Bacteroidota bacterium]
MKLQRKIVVGLGGLVLVGLVGSGFGSQLVNSTQSAVSRIKKIIEVFQIVERYYVEEPDEDKMVKGAISGMLETLDPHSVYIPKKSLNKMTEQFEGYFYGIGIEFVVQNKLITVVSPVVGGPAERLGIRPGDQIIKINGESAYDLSEDEVMAKLRGPKGTRVTVTIRRP